MLYKKIFSFLLFFFLLSPNGHIFAYSPAYGPNDRIEASGLLIRASGFGPIYTNIDKYTFVYTDNTSGFIGGPFSYYIKTQIFYLGILGIVLIILLTFLSLKKRKLI